MYIVAAIIFGTMIGGPAGAAVMVVLAIVARTAYVIYQRRSAHL